MVESNYDILGIVEGTTEKEIRDAFRRLALQFHSDRGGENEQFIKIKQAYDDLKIGKKYQQFSVMIYVVMAIFSVKLWFITNLQLIMEKSNFRLSMIHSFKSFIYPRIYKSNDY